MNTLNVKRRMFIIISLVAIIFSSLSFISNESYNKSNAAWGFCKEVGSSMSIKDIGSDSSGVANPDAGNRKWTAEELFRGSVAFTTFYGEGEGTFFMAEKQDRGKDVAGWSEDVQTRIEAARGFNCTVGGMDWVHQIFILMASGITAFTSSILSYLFSNDTIAQGIANIVGGEGGNDKGLIGTFFSSFYAPLVIIAFVLMTVTIVYKGLIKMQFREALNSILWSVGAFVIGVALMLNPQMLASAPSAVTSTITTCVMGALSGQNCMTGDVIAPATLSGTECISTTNGGNATQSAVNGLNCTVWKAFVLEPWAESQYGQPYKDLYTKNPPDGGTIWSGLPEGQANKYCVNLSSVKSHREAVKSGELIMDGSGGTVCNVALYHLFLKTNMKDPVNQNGNDRASKMVTDDTGEYDSRWYDIIIPMAQDESKWRYWSGQGMFFDRLGTSMISLIGTIAAATVLVTLAVFGGAYKLISMLLIAFAPVFFLLAIEPTKGKRMFLGWLETIVSSFLKYFAITVLVLVSLIMYAGILSNTSGMYSIVAIAIITVALHMYRKEIVDLIGASNMGGERLSNKVNEIGSKAGKFAKEKAAATAGGALGGSLANLGDRSRKIKARKDTIEELKKGLAEAEESGNAEAKNIYRDRIKEEEEALEKETEKSALATAAKGAVRGSKESAERSMKRGTGFTSNVLQQKGRTSAELEKNAKADKEQREERQQDFNNKLAETMAENRNNTETPNEVVAPNSNQNSPTQEVPNNGEVLVAEGTETGNNENTSRVVAIEELINSQREQVELPENLSEEEKASLNEFADKLASNSMSSEELVSLANSEVDPNKKQMVANEINARIRANSMIGVASNELGRSILAEPENLSNEELKFNLQMHTENYLETGDERELAKYLSSRQELAIRTGDEFNSQGAEEAIRNFKNKVGDNYERKASVPTESEMRAFGSDFNLTINEDTSLDSNNVTTPENLASQVSGNKELIDRARGVEPVLPNLEQVEKQLPILDEVEQKSTEERSGEQRVPTPSQTVAMPDLDLTSNYEAQNVNNNSGNNENLNTSSPVVNTDSTLETKLPNLDNNVEGGFNQQQPEVQRETVEIPQKEQRSESVSVENQEVKQPEVQQPTSPNQELRKSESQQPIVQELKQHESQQTTVTVPTKETRRTDVEQPTVKNQEVKQPEVQQQVTQEVKQPEVQQQVTQEVKQPEVQQQVTQEVKQPEVQQQVTQEVKQPEVQQPTVKNQEVKQPQTSERLEREKGVEPVKEQETIVVPNNESKHRDNSSPVTAPQYAEELEQNLESNKNQDYEDMLDSMLDEIGSVDDLDSPIVKPREKE